jgi:hypothetical protein
MVNPLNVAARVSPDLNETTDPEYMPSMIVTSGPSSLATVMFFPPKLINSKYTPGATRTVSPCVAALMAS